MIIASPTIRINQSILPIGTVTKLRAPEVVAANMAAMAENILGWMLEDKQRELLTGPNRRVILNCTRQWGKSWMAAVALLFHALHHPDSLSIVAGPTLRPSAKGPTAGRQILKEHESLWPSELRFAQVL